MVFTMPLTVVEGISFRRTLAKACDFVILWDFGALESR